MWESFLITALGKNILLPPIPRACQAPARPADISAGLFPTLPLPAATRASLLRNNEGIGSPGDGSSDTGNRHWCLPSPHHADQLQISVRTHRPALAGQRSLPGPAKGTRAKIGAGTEFLLSGIEKINKNIWETRSCPHRLRTAVAERIAAAPTWFTENSGSSDGQGAAGTASHSQPESSSVPPHAGPGPATKLSRPASRPPARPAQPRATSGVSRRCPARRARPRGGGRRREPRGAARRPPRSPWPRSAPPPAGGARPARMLSALTGMRGAGPPGKRQRVVPSGAGFAGPRGSRPEDIQWSRSIPALLKGRARFIIFLTN